MASNKYNNSISIPVKLHNVNFTFAQDTLSGLAQSHSTQDLRVLRNITLSIPIGQRILLVGGNGAGKSTLLRVLAGKHLLSDDSARVFGRDAFRDTQLNAIRTYVSSEWGQRSVAFASHAMAYSADIPIAEMMEKLQSEYPARRDELLRILRIDPQWRLHKLSDGQRRRVQLFLALIRPSQLILLDEVLGLLDLISRSNLLQFLKQESETRQATIILATHIFDGTEAWGTHVMYLKHGELDYYGPMKEFTTISNETDKTKDISKNAYMPMYEAVEWRLRKEIELDGDNIKENEAGPIEPSATTAESDVLNTQNRAGGYAAGRLSGMM